MREADREFFVKLASGHGWSTSISRSFGQFARGPHIVTVSWEGPLTPGYNIALRATRGSDRTESALRIETLYGWLTEMSARPEAGPIPPKYRREMEF